MGTNYYWVENPCDTCGHSDNKTHIGKSSGGWTFSFHETFDCKSWKDWKEYFANNEGKIIDEYGKHVSINDFEKMILRKSTEENNHAICAMDHASYLDPEGHSFTKGTFF